MEICALCKKSPRGLRSICTLCKFPANDQLSIRIGYEAQHSREGSTGRYIFGLLAVTCACTKNENKA